MKRKAFKFSFIIRVCFFSLIFSEIEARNYPVDIILEKGTRTYLNHITGALLKHDFEDVHEYSLGSLILEPEAELYLNESSKLLAHHIYLQEKSKLQIFGGNTLRIKCDIFDAGKLKGKKDQLGIVSLEAHPSVFYPSSKQSFFTPRRGRVDASFKNSNERQPAQAGLSGRKGSTGNNGARAGILYLEAQEFYGGYFLAKGGLGQQGGRGEDGGEGGHGFRCEHFINHNPISPSDFYPSEYASLLNGQDGGRPGMGGDGGRGGDGGHVLIKAKEKHFIPGRNYFSETEGGRGGDVGEVGTPGAPGNAGYIWVSIPRVLAQENFHFNNKYNGRGGQVQATPFGKSVAGSSGQAGSDTFEP